MIKGHLRLIKTEDTDLEDKQDDHEQWIKDHEERHRQIKEYNKNRSFWDKFWNPEDIGYSKR